MYVILLWTYWYFTANWQNKYEIVVVKNFLLCVESYFISRCYAISNDDDDIVVCDANVLLNPGYFYWQPQEIVVIENVIVLLLAYTFYHPNFVVIIIRQHFLWRYTICTTKYFVQSTVVHTHDFLRSNLMDNINGYIHHNITWWLGLNVSHSLLFITFLKSNTLCLVPVSSKFTLSFIQKISDKKYWDPIWQDIS